MLAHQPSTRSGPRTLRLRRLQRYLGLFALTLLLNTCTGQDQPPLAFAYHPWPGYASLYLAENFGWLKDAQVTLHNTPSASASIAALRKVSSMVLR
ncbi:MAG: hypothetical protein RQ715_01170 [Methylococcales bacterium]|nr:hypothetical protein [Methylococcales bacterium]